MRFFVLDVALHIKQISQLDALFVLSLNNSLNIASDV